ncbi:Trimethyllysine dioxygenase [Mollisia scopiformis]|uniref:Trimethyllysine dioxygenase n=1 Tax=Mollisia scopiformis TaxID=149040 RepID=A0A194XL29_MOLSC|nr:Trimethyllysine dioxygenase [Mollisia scopiformis]KUJ20883.1 Trimethyllysine dioxygenase [Mollisia scopiformis]
MNTGVRRLYGVSRSLPRPFRRSIATGASASETATNEPVKATPKFEPKAEDSPTKVHENLDKRYEIGGRLEFGPDPLDRHDEKGLLKWGAWGVPIKLETAKGGSVTTASNFWLRDNCRCDKCINQDTMQRAFDTFSIDSDIIPEEVITEKDGLKVKWAEDGHVSKYDWDWLIKHRSNPLPGYMDKEKKLNRHTYWGAEISSNPPSVHYDEIMGDENGVGAWTDKIREYGFCYVDGCPVSPEKTQELLERIAFIRVTHYGGFYDFTADLTIKDTAYTNLALPAHTDTTYFTDPAGLQMFHLLSHTDGSGGASLLVDGFNAARELEKESRAAYDILAKTPISWHASGNEGVTITPAKKVPVLNFHDVVEKKVPNLMQVRWNNDDRGVVALREDHGMGAEKWYSAARKWNAILKKKDMEYWAQLEPGRPLIFDNWRVLHGRSAFTGKRRICGGYINHDDYVSRWRNTNSSREEVLKQIL